MKKSEKISNIVPEGEGIAQVFTLDQLCMNPDNPRKSRNPRYDDIKASVRSQGLNSVPLVTRDPRLPEGMWTFSDGGNTRYAIMRELWDETGDPRFFRMTCVVKPWSGRFQCLTGHLVENETHGQLTFIDKALSVQDARQLLEEEIGKKVSLRELAAALAEQGLPVHYSSVSRMEEVIRHIYPWMPELLRSGFGGQELRKLIRLRSSAESVWEQYQAEKFVETHSDFTSVFGQCCLKFDSPELWSLEMFTDELIGDLTEAFPCEELNYDGWLLELKSNRKPDAVITHEDTPCVTAGEIVPPAEFHEGFTEKVSEADRPQPDPPQSAGQRSPDSPKPAEPEPLSVEHDSSEQLINTPDIFRAEPDSQDPVSEAIPDAAEQRDHIIPDSLWHVNALQDDNQPIARAVQQLCQKAGSGSVISVEKKRDKTPAPLCFTLGTLMEVCNKKWGFGANEVLSIAQSLYETHKATTYPRTDCGYLPVSMREEVKDVLQAIQQSDPTITPELARLDTAFTSRVWNDKKITAHHAIIPTRQAFEIAKLNAKELKVYSLIRLHYLAQFMPLQETDVTDATFNIGNQLFRTRGRVMVHAGWKSLFSGELSEEGEEEKESAAQLPALEQGSVCSVTGADVKDNMTKAPPYHTEGTLIAAMKNAASLVTDPQLKKVLRDNAGLGTEATRSGVLETLFKRGFLGKKGKFIQSTQMARELIAALPETLTSPGMTALWEQALDDIAQGKSGLSEFMQKQTQWTRHLIEKGRVAAFKVTAQVGPACPQCGGPTRLRKNKQGKFWGCMKFLDCKGIVGETNRKTRRQAAGKTRGGGKGQRGSASAPVTILLQSQKG